MIEVLRPADLLDAAAIHHHDAIGKRHRLDLVMGDIDRGRLHLLVHALDLGSHLHAQLRVQIAQWLVEQKYFRITHDGTAHRNSLPLAAG